MRSRRLAPRSGIGLPPLDGVGLCFRPPEQTAEVTAPWELQIPEPLQFAPFREAPLTLLQPFTTVAPRPAPPAAAVSEEAPTEIPITPLPLIEPPMVPIPSMNPPQTPVPGRAIAGATANAARIPPAISEEAQAEWKLAAGRHEAALAEAEAAQRREVMRAERRLGEMIRSAEVARAR